MSLRAPRTHLRPAARSRLEPSSHDAVVPRSKELLHPGGGRILRADAGKPAALYPSRLRPSSEPRRLPAVSLRPSPSRGEDRLLIPCDPVVQVTGHLAVRVSARRAHQGTAVLLDVVLGSEAVGSQVGTEAVVETTADKAGDSPLQRRQRSRRAIDRVAPDMWLSRTCYLPTVERAGHFCAWQPSQVLCAR
jgi:hypothetical protein